MRSPGLPWVSGHRWGNDISKETQTLVCIQNGAGHSNLLNCSKTRLYLKTSVSPQILKSSESMSAIRCQTPNLVQRSSLPFKNSIRTLSPP